MRIYKAYFYSDNFPIPFFKAPLPGCLSSGRLFGQIRTRKRRRSQRKMRSKTVQSYRGFNCSEKKLFIWNSTKFSNYVFMLPHYDLYNLLPPIPFLSSPFSRFTASSFISPLPDLLPLTAHLISFSPPNRPSPPPHLLALLGFKRSLGSAPRFGQSAPKEARRCSRESHLLRRCQRSRVVD